MSKPSRLEKIIGKRSEIDVAAGNRRGKDEAAWPRLDLGAPSTVGPDRVEALTFPQTSRRSGLRDRPAAAARPGERGSRTGA